MKKVFAFDLDNTLAELGKGIPDHIIRQLKQIESSGHIIAICSGKPTYYLCGMMRQVGLKAPVLIGENGATIQFGVDLPPEKRYRAHYDAAADNAIHELRRRIDQNAGFSVWFQPNEVCLTPFYHTPQQEIALEEVFSENQILIDTYLDIFKHCDSFDLIPKGVNKRSGLSRLAEILDISRECFVAIGNGKNDYPMFKYAGVSIGVRVSESNIVDHNFEKIDDALVYIIKYLL